MKDSEFGTNRRARTLSGEYPSSAALKARTKGSEPTHVSVNAKGERTLHNDFYSASKVMFGNPGWIETHPAGKVIWTGPYGDKQKHEETKKKVAPGIQLGAGGEDSVKDKETNKNEWTKAVAAELSEAWWCGTPALEAADRAVRRDQARKHAGKIERSQLPDSPPKGLRFKGKPRPAPEVERPAEHMDNWIGSSNTLEAVIDEVTKPKPKPASKPASKPAAKPTSKSKPSSAKPEKTGDENHAALLKKMAMTVTNSTAKGISPKHILAAGYALHTFDDETLSTPKNKPKSKPKKESIDISGLEKVVDEAYYDTSMYASHRASKLSGGPGRSRGFGGFNADADLFPNDTKITPMQKVLGQSRIAKADVDTIKKHHVGDREQHNADELGATAAISASNAVTKLRDTGLKPKELSKMAGFARDRRMFKFPESVEQIVNDFLEDTMTGDIGSIALGFAPTGEMDPHEGRPGPGKKKKKKNQFDRLTGMVSKNRYHKLTQKVAGAMPT